jgi:hypothetical protein
MILAKFQNRFPIGTVKKYYEVSAFYSLAFDATIVSIPAMKISTSAARP